MSDVKHRLGMTLANAGVPVDTITLTGTPPSGADVTYMPGATPDQIATGAAVLAAFDWSDAAQAAFDAAVDRVRANLLLDAREAAYTLLRGVVSVTVDEVNALRQWVTSFKAAVAASSSLADLKTRVAALANTPDRTLAQARTAIKNAIDNGTVDS